VNYGQVEAQDDGGLLFLQNINIVLAGAVPSFASLWPNQCPEMISGLPTFRGLVAPKEQENKLFDKT
jgi:hypothetical protein